jgi:hypothetical protein
LIPPIDDLPGAGTLVIETGLLDRALGVRPDLVAPLERALDYTEPDLFPGLALKDGEAWMALIVAVAGAYYLDPRVRARIGYEGQIARPTRPDNYPTYIAEGLLDHLLDGEWAQRWDREITT